ncbi:chymotrypsin-1-like isoform X2 [Cloeon dipterum]|uniref:chymotrypsin-1-like isoform X2 n=1 Tax=Cloeon dipterum TaxID=197152 RepID=UPI003220170B
MYVKSILIAALLAGVATAATIESRIVNGTDVPEGKYPFAVSLRSYGSHTCGGSIISSVFALTAAHCVDASTPDSLVLVAGSVHMNQGHGHQVVEIIVHEQWNSGASLNDIAILRVDEPFDFQNPLLAPVRLPGQYDQTVADTPATVIGWGLNSSSGTIQLILQEVDIFLFCDEECYDLHGSRYNPNNVCAGVRGGGKGQCNGDSGGPLLVNGQQVGIVSWSKKPCTEAPYPGVYTQVSSFIDWIKSKVPV